MKKQNFGSWEGNKKSSFLAALAAVFKESNYTRHGVRIFTSPAEFVYDPVWEILYCQEKE